jgi:hypothetical protein
MECRDASRSLVALDQNSTIIAVVELSQSSWLVAGVLPGIERQPCKKLDPSPERLLAVLHRWRDETVRAGRTITRIAVAFEAGRDGFWLAPRRRRIASDGCIRANKCRFAFSLSAFDESGLGLIGDPRQGEHPIAVAA